MNTQGVYTMLLAGRLRPYPGSAALLLLTRSRYPVLSGDRLVAGHQWDKGRLKRGAIRIKGNIQGTGTGTG